MGQPKMKILFIADHLKFGGAERHLVAVATGLVKRGHETTVAYLKPHDELAGELHAGGVSRVVCCNSKGGADWRAIRALARQIDDFAPNMLISTSQYSLAMGVAARTLAARRPPLLFVCHSMEHVCRSRRDRIRFAIYRHFYRMAEHVVFVSELQRRFFAELGVTPRSSEVIHNGIDLDLFSAAHAGRSAPALRRELGFADNDLVIGMCAGFREEKRQVDLLEAVRRLRDRNIPAKALLVGDGIMRPAIEARRDALGLQGDVVLCGFQHDVAPYVAACDILALTSHAETFPIATLEYMALSKPLVASAVGGLAEQVEHGRNGLLYPAGDIPRLVDCLESLTSDGARHTLGQSARHAVEARFSLTTMIDRFQTACFKLSPGQST